MLTKPGYEPMTNPPLIDIVNQKWTWLVLTNLTLIDSCANIYVLTASFQLLPTESA